MTAGVTSAAGAENFRKAYRRLLVQLQLADSHGALSLVRELNGFLE